MNGNKKNLNSLFNKFECRRTYIHILSVLFAFCLRVQGCHMEVPYIAMHGHSVPEVASASQTALCPYTIPLGLVLWFRPPSLPF